MTGWPSAKHSFQSHVDPDLISHGICSFLFLCNASYATGCRTTPQNKYLHPHDSQLFSCSFSKSSLIFSTNNRLMIVAREAQFELHLSTALLFKLTLIQMLPWKLQMLTLVMRSQLWLPFWWLLHEDTVYHSHYSLPLWSHFAFLPGSQILCQLPQSITAATDRNSLQF